MGKIWVILVAVALLLAYPAAASAEKKKAADPRGDVFTCPYDDPGDCYDSNDDFDISQVLINHTSSRIAVRTNLYTLSGAGRSGGEYRIEMSTDRDRKAEYYMIYGRSPPMVVREYSMRTTRSSAASDPTSTPSVIS